MLYVLWGPGSHVIPGCPEPSDFSYESLAENIGGDAVQGPIVDVVDEVPEDQQRLTRPDQSTQRVEFAVHVGDEQHQSGSSPPPASTVRAYQAAKPAATSAARVANHRFHPA